MNLSRYPLVIFDADNTLRQTLVPGQPCPRAPHEWQLMPGTRDRLAQYDWQHGPRFGVATNQDQIAFGLVSEDMVMRLLRDMITAAIGPAAGRALIGVCPHDESAGCDCRKPQPGLLLRLCEDAAVPPSSAIFIGDAPSDQEAATRAGTDFMWAAEFFGR